MSQPLLSVCIPTRNRKDKLLSQVNTILAQADISGIADRVQIIIGDNTDIEQQLLDPSCFTHQSIKYIKNTGNIGYARNVNNVLCSADGEFAWLLSDDDTLADNALCTIFSAILEHRQASYITFDARGVYLGNVFDSSMFFSDIDSA